MKKVILIILTIVIFLLVGSCNNSVAVVQSSTTPEPTIEPTPEPTATPEPIISFLGEEIPLSELEAGYTFELYGQELNTVTTTELHYLKEDIGDEGLDDFRQVLPYMKNLTYLTFDRCGTTDEAMAELRDEFRDTTKIAWRVFFGASFTNMSDAKTIWASVDIYTDEQVQNLKYFEDLVNLDIGHGCFSDLSFLYSTPNIETLIVACNTNITDITPIGSLKHLKYLEIGECDISDLSPLANCTELEHLNFGCNQHVTDLTPLENFPNIKRLYGQSIFNSALNMVEEQEKFDKLYPNADVDFGWYGVNAGAQLAGRWRYSNGIDGGNMVEKYAEIREIFDYDHTDYNVARQTADAADFYTDVFYGP